jgi:hypothetical protein
LLHLIKVESCKKKKKKKRKAPNSEDLVMWVAFM